MGLGAPDDAAVWRLDERRALVVTTDFFTPIVDDPYDYGAIAAANALSDLYAMGATPMMALSVVCLPPDLGGEIIQEIVRGMADMVRRAGAVIAGGHSIQDQEPKVGLMAVGMAHPQQLMTKSSARSGDSLILTKPLGTGVISTALKANRAEAEHVATAVRWMKQLNERAAALALEFGVRAATDITGFSLLGHGVELSQASGVALRVNVASVPFLAGARIYAEAGFIAGGTADNRDHFGPQVEFGDEVDEISRILLFDAQTSGGLLLAVPEAQAESFLLEAARRELPVWLIGRVETGSGVRAVLSKEEVAETAHEPGAWQVADAP